jgi:uncharacterized protein YrrD
MDFKEGANVFTDDGKRVGHIDRVVIDPKSKEVNNIIVHEGLIFKEDKVVPVSLIASAIEDRVVLRKDTPNLDALPKFEESHFIPLEEEECALINYEAFNIAPLYMYPPYGVEFPLQRVEIEKHIPKGSTALKIGAKVISVDGEHVGDVEEVLTGPEADRVTHFVIAKGFLFKHEKLVPATWVSRLGENEVQLEVGSRLLEELPEHRK